MPLSLSSDEIEQRKLLFGVCQTREQLKDWVYVVLDFELPDCVVDPDSNTTMLDMVWSTYQHLTQGPSDDTSRRLFYSSRDGGKTLAESITEVLVLLHVGVGIVHLAAIEEQSKNAQRYLKGFFSQPLLRSFVHGDNVRETSAIYYRPKDPKEVVITTKEFKELPSDEQLGYYQVVARAEIVVATMQSVNGKHGILFEDELDVLSQPQVHKEAQNIPSMVRLPDGRSMLPITVLTSTRKSAFGLVQDEINRKAQTELDVRHWNVIDVTKACPKTRHRPDLPRLPIYRNPDELRAVDERTYLSLSDKEKATFIRDEGYTGCIKNCKIFAACRGNLATRQTSTSKFLKPVEFVQQKFRDNDLDMAKAQLMCWEPSSKGLVYARLDRAKHVLSPAQVYQKIWGERHVNPQLTKAELMDLISEREGIEHYGGMDYGDTHLFAYSHGIKDGSRIFVTHVVAASGLEPDQRVELCSPFRQYGPSVFGDTEDPMMNRIMRKNGFNMRTWKKNKGSLLGGISAVQAKLSPVLGDEPEMFFVHDYGEDPGMDLAIQHMAEFHWKLDAAGRPTLMPADDNKDIPDAIRYMVMNVFPLKGSGVTAGQQATVATVGEEHIVSSRGAGYDPNDWVRQLIAERTGGQPPAPRAQPRRMTIEAPPGSGYQSYYADDNGQAKAATPKKGKKSDEPAKDQEPEGAGKSGRLIWNL